jgi:hypothetical protein
MIASRVDRTRLTRTLLGLVAIGIAAGLAIPAAAQIGPPIRLLPRDNIDEPAHPADPARPATPRNEPLSIGPAPFEPLRPRENEDSRRIEQTPIEVTAPKPIDGDGAGAIEAARGALPETLWRGSSRPTIERLIGEMPAPIVSPSVRKLAVRVLASGGEPPAAGTAEARSFAAQRAEKLLALGAVAEAAALASVVPTRNEDAALGRVLLDAAWIAYDDSAACDLTFKQIAQFDDAYRQKSLIFCQAAKNDKDRARLGLRLLQEQQTEEDPLFARLISIALGESRGPLESLKQPLPLHLAMARTNRLQVPADAAPGAAPAVLAMIAAAANTSSDTRVGASERAEAVGAITTAALAQIYDGLAIRPDDLAKAFDLVARDRGPRSRWLPYRAAKAQPADSSRLAILARYWQMARDRTGFAAAARLTAPLVQEITPTSDVLAYTGDIARVLLLSGDGARPWIEAAETAGKLDANTADAAALAWPLLRIAGQADGVSDAAARLEAWRKAQQRLNPQGVASRVATLASLLTALGDAAAGELLAQAASASSPDRPQAASPALGVMIAIGDAAGNKRVGETALLAVAAVGGDGPANMPMLALVRVLESLRTVGLTADARAMALEAAILSGL